ncbi:response regulator transcription factor [Yoonia sp. GPGPB17]|uniref:response regulator transcription factor n=1 Tax=Yoonia sp. GPGPB17 TaxID=3026147 RepID=UPI0030C32B55
MKILIVEDDTETANYLTRGLREAGWEVTWHNAPQEAMLTLAGRSFDAIVLDRMLPGMDGVDALRLMRGAKITTPILMLTARSGLEDRVEGLEAGADDYLVKPFAMSELVARLRSLARRPPMAVKATNLHLGDLHLDRISRQAMRGGDRLDLSPLEYRLLDYLIQRPGEVVTRSMLLEQVWGYRFDPKTSLVQTHMSRLRAKVDKPYAQEMIRTIRGAGYVIDAP